VTTIFDKATKRGALRSRLAEAVKGFDRAMAAEELAVLAQELAGAQPEQLSLHQVNGHQRPAKRSPKKTPVKPAVKTAAKAAEPAMPRRSGKAVKAKNEGPRAREVIELLTAKPRTPIADLAETMYGSRSEATQGKVRNILMSLKGSGQALNVGLGQWEAAAQ
jgi:hypothetical protein